LAVSAVEAMNPAFEHAKAQLLRPFRFGQWVRLAFVGFLAGELTSGGGCNYSNFSIPHTPHPRGSGTGPMIHSALPGPVLEHPVAAAAGFALFLVAGLLLLFTLAYAGSVMRFILFDSIITRECHVRKGWRKHSRESRHAWDLFVWHVAVMLCSAVGVLLVFGVPLAAAAAFGWLTHARDHVVELILGGAALLIAFLAFVFALALVQVITKDFVVPQMALENITASEGWRRLWPTMKSEKGGYAGYVGMKIVLTIGAGVAVGIVSLIILLVLAVPVGGVGVVAVLAGKAAGLTWNFFTISAALVAAVVAFMALMFLTSLISVPVIVFFPAYSIYFFAPRYAPLAAALWPQSGGPVAKVAPPLEPPPFPPTPAPLG
jgi:hypothetical protein